MNKNNMIEKYEYLSNKLRSKEDAITWNKNFTKKANKIILILLLLNTIMVLPILLYTTSIISNLVLVTEFIYLGMCGMVCGAITLMEAFILNMVLFANKLHLNKTKIALTKNIDELVKKISNSNVKKTTKIETNQKSNNYSYKPNAYNNTKTNSLLANTTSKNNTSNSNKKLKKLKP